MTSTKFTLTSQKLGLSLRSVSIGVVTVLAEIEKKPLPLVKRESRSKNITRTVPRGSPSIGPAISHGLAELRRNDSGGEYHITPKGIEYLTLLRHHNLIPS